MPDQHIKTEIIAGLRIILFRENTKMFNTCFSETVRSHKFLKSKSGGALNSAVGYH